MVFLINFVLSIASRILLYYFFKYKEFGKKYAWLMSGLKKRQGHQTVTRSTDDKVSSVFGRELGLDVVNDLVIDLECLVQNDIVDLRFGTEEGVCNGNDAGILAAEGGESDRVVAASV